MIIVLQSCGKLIMFKAKSLKKITIYRNEYRFYVKKSN